MQKYKSRAPAVSVHTAAKQTNVLTKKSFDNYCNINNKSHLTFQQLNAFNVK